MKLALPTPACTMPAFSTRNSTAPPLAALTAAVTSIVTVPTLGFGIMPRGPEHLAETADKAHHVRRGDAAVEIDRALVDDLDQVFRADNIGAGLLGFLRLGALGEHPDAHLAARAVRQVAHAAHHLVGMAWVDAQIHRHFDGLVELGVGPGLDQLHRLVERIELGAVDAFRVLVNTLWSFAMVLLHHFKAHRPGRTGNLAGRRIKIAGIHALDLLSRRSRGTGPWSLCQRRALPGSLEPALILAAFFRKYDAGGDFISKVKDLS